MPLIKLNPDIVRQSVNAMQAVLREIEDITRDVGSRYDDWSAPEKADMDTMAVDCKRYGDALSVIANAHCANARRAVEALVNEDAAQRRNVEDLSAGTAAVASVFGSLSVFNQIMTDITGGGGKALALQWLDEWAKRFGQMSFFIPFAAIISEFDKWFPNIVTPEIVEPIASIEDVIPPAMDSYYYKGPHSGLTRILNTGKMNCVYYCYSRIWEKTGVEPTALNGGPYRYLQVAQSNGYEVSTDVIRANSVAVFGGHVLIIENVTYDDSGNPLTISFSEGNWGNAQDGEIKELSYQEFIKKRGKPNGYVYF